MSAVSEPGGDTGRVRCLYCGANNFPASVACWQCSRPLKAMRPAPAETPGISSSRISPPGASPAPPAFGQAGAAVRPAFAESALAPKVAAALGMLFPYIGLPAGMIFLMLDDPRKTQLGWLLIGWSVAGTVINVVSLAITLGPLWALLRGMIPHPGGGAAPSIPGLPTDGGEGLILLLRSFMQV
jgi:hypothetical protein